MVARNDVDVAMQHRLAGLYSVVRTHIEAVRWRV